MPRYFISKEDCPNCEDAYSYLVDSDKEPHHIQSAAGELSCVGDMGRMLVALLLSKNDSEAMIEFPVYITIGKEAVQDCQRIFSGHNDEEVECKDGTCSLKSVITGEWWED